jgi:hypothetical protein
MVKPTEKELAGLGEVPGYPRLALLWIRFPLGTYRSFGNSYNDAVCCHLFLIGYFFQQDNFKFKESISFSTTIILSLPSDWYPSGKERYEKILKSNLHMAILERLIGWGLMLLFIATLNRLLIRY